MAEQYYFAADIPNYDYLKGAWKRVHSPEEADKAILTAAERYRPHVDYRTEEERKMIVQRLTRAAKAGKHVVTGYDWYGDVTDTDYYLTVFDDGSVYRLASQNNGWILSGGFSELKEIPAYEIIVPGFVRAGYAKLVFAPRFSG